MTLNNTVHFLIKRSDGLELKSSTITGAVLTQTSKFTPTCKILLFRREVLRRARSIIEDATCIKFREYDKDADRDFIIITKSWRPGCHSFVGRQGSRYTGLIKKFNRWKTEHKTSQVLFYRH